MSPNFTTPITFVYGDNDWVRKEVDFDLADKMAEKNTNFKVINIVDSTHDMVFDNPLGVCNLIKNEILGTKLSVGSDITRKFS